MYNAIEDLYILYIEETLSSSAVYTIHSSRLQSFLLSIYTLCTIPHSAACISPAILIHCFCISPFSIWPGLGDRGDGWCWGSWWGGSSPPTLPAMESASLNPCFPGRLHPRCPGWTVGPWRGAGIAPGPMEGWRPGQAGAVAWTAGRWDS